MSFIKPTIGRVVWYHSQVGQQPHAALIAYVHSDILVNLAVFDANGHNYHRTSIWLRQDEDEATRPACGYAEFMPYQKGQAAKTEELERALATTSAPVALLNDAALQMATGVKAD